MTAGDAFLRAIRDAFERAARDEAARQRPRRREYVWRAPGSDQERRGTIDTADFSPAVAGARARDCEARALLASAAERARLLAERDAWLEAALHDRKLEACRARARIEASEALRAAERGDLERARRHASAACVLEPAWARLENAIATGVRGAAAGGGEDAAGAPAAGGALAFLGADDRARFARAADLAAEIVERWGDGAREDAGGTAAARIPPAAERLAAIERALSAIAAGTGGGPAELGVLGCALAAALAGRLGFRWTILEDDAGPQLALADRSASLLVFPLGALARAAGGSLRDVLEQTYIVERRDGDGPV